MDPLAARGLTTNPALQGVGQEAADRLQLALAAVEQATDRQQPGNSKR